MGVGLLFNAESLDKYYVIVSSVNMYMLRVCVPLIKLLYVTLMRIVKLGMI
ncbi:hypothetical protein GCM10008933_39400 [Paenibacillus motobuensis]|uniref:Uncharacterized protein n=1 Tax=Paenibacillus motobuensis TaxID=295324 RepID=A0ABP3IIF0_9BACL